MPFEDINDYYLLMLSYFKDEKISPLPKGFSCYPLITNKAKLVCDVIKDGWEILPIEKKLSIIDVIDKAIKESKTKYSEKIRKFKEVLAKDNNWKDELLGVKSVKLQDSKYAPINYDADAAKAYDAAFKSVACQNTYSIVGSYFKTNVQRHLANNKKEGHCLDAFFLTQQKKDHSFAFALGDGAGGHFGDINQDKAIARAAHFATKHALRLLNTFAAPEEFAKSLKWYIAAIEHEVRQKAGSEATTLVAGRAFLADNKYHCVGFSIGDSLCFGWDPQQKYYIPIAPAQVLPNGSANFPSSYHPYELFLFDVVLPIGCIVLSISDGIYDHLPCDSFKKEYVVSASDKKSNEEKNPYVETTLKHDFITALFSQIAADAPPQVYADLLCREVMQRMEKMRREKIELSASALQRRPVVEAELLRQEKLIDRSNKDEMRRIQKPLDDLMADLDIQIGDDMAIAAIALVPPPKKSELSPRVGPGLKSS